MTTNTFKKITDQTCYVFDDDHYMIAFGHSQDDTKPIIQVYTAECEIVHDVFSEMVAKHWNINPSNAILKHYTENKFKCINPKQSFRDNCIKTNQIIFVEFN